MVAKFKTAKQLYAQDKDFVLFPNIASTYRCIAHAVTATYERRTNDLAKSDGSEKAAKSAPGGHSSLLPRTVI